MSLTSPDSNGIGRYVESTPVGTTFSGYLNKALDSVSTAITSLLAKRAILGFRWANGTAQGAASGMATGDFGYRTDQGITYRYDGAAWKAWESGWIGYTATLGNFAVGTGGSALQLTEYKFDAGRMRIRFRFILGTTGASVTGAPLVLIPAGYTLRTPIAGGETMLAEVSLSDAGGSGVYKGYAAYSATSTDRFQIRAASNAAPFITNVSGSAPFSWGAADGIIGELIVDLA